MSIFDNIIATFAPSFLFKVGRVYHRHEIMSKDCIDEEKASVSMSWNGKYEELEVWGKSGYAVYYFRKDDNHWRYSHSSILDV